MESCDPVGTPMEIKDRLDLDQNGTPAKPTEKHLKEVKRIFCYLRGIVNTDLWYTKDSGFELTGFLDVDYAGCKDTFKSTSVLWMRTQLTDYGFYFKKIPIYCDSKSAISISYNPVQHSRTKHIAVRYHFIKEHIEKGTIELYFVKTDYQLADIFTKALPSDRFNYLVRRLVDMAYWEELILRIGYKSALTLVEIDLTWSLGLVSVELASIEARISLIGLEFSLCLYSDSLINLLRVSFIDCLRSWTRLPPASLLNSVEDTSLRVL
nr:hypothetical protein [Tanacetum cinerariifolium]